MAATSEVRFGSTKNTFIFDPNSVVLNEKYSVVVDKEIIGVADRTTDVVVAKLKNRSEECADWSNPTHCYKGIHYFVLSSEKYTKAKYVYSFDPEKKDLKAIVASLRNPYFFENQLVDCGSGFTTPGEQIPDMTMRDGKGVITIYDLTIQQGSRKIDTIYIEGGGGQGWESGLDEKTKKITAYCYATSKFLEFPLDKKV